MKKNYFYFLFKKNYFIFINFIFFLSYTGENIKQYEKKEGDLEHIMTPYYHKGEISSNKPDLPFGLAEIYRYV
jgi:hypothetical protein